MCLLVAVLFLLYFVCLHFPGTKGSATHHTLMSIALPLSAPFKTLRFQVLGYISQTTQTICFRTLRLYE